MTDNNFSAAGDDSIFEWQGRVQTELTEKIAFGLALVGPSNRMMFATDICDLISEAINESHKPVEDIWETVNSRMGQHLALYFKGDVSTLPEHIKAEIVGMLNHAQGLVEFERVGKLA